MVKDTRLGSDPLSWIEDTRGKGCKHSIQSKQDLQDKQIKGKRGRPKTSTRVITKSSQEGTREAGHEQPL